MGQAADLRVAHLAGGNWLNEGATLTSGNSSTGTVTGNNISDWGAFALGSLSPASPLPLKLAAFGASLHGPANRIRWTTGVEADNLRYEIERSTDGRAFAAIGSVAAGGGGHYTFDDNRPPGGTAYYRLRIRERDGSSFSSIASLTRTASGHAGFSLYPNPAQHDLQLSSTGPASVSLTDMSGRIFLRIQIDGNQRIPLTGLAAGSYLVRFEGGGMSETIRLLKQ